MRPWFGLACCRTQVILDLSMFAAHVAQHDLVIAFDILFHIVDALKLANAIANIDRV